MPNDEAGRSLQDRVSAAGTDAGPSAGALSTDVAGEVPRRKSGKRKRILVLVALLALAGGGYEGYHWWTVGRFAVSTDDAYVESDMSIVSAKVGGYVASVEAGENAVVKTGQVIARIDDADYRLAVQAAQDRIGVQQATIDRIEVQIAAARAKIDEARANLDSARAQLEFANGEFDRKTRLVNRDFASQQALDTARADRDKARAGVAAAEAALTSAQVNVSVLEAQRLEAVETLKSLRTALHQAKRDLAYTAIRAPVDGVVGNRAVDVGELVQAGSRLAAVVPLDSVYVDANFKETQLAAMRPGQRVEIEVDAYPGRVFEGEVESISPASGALFSLLPPQNATGNFTKIVQRLPVRIRLSDEATSDHVLRPGMSVVATVDTRTGPGAEPRDAETGEGRGVADTARDLVRRAKSVLGLDEADAVPGATASVR